MLRTLISKWAYYGLVPRVRSGYLADQRRRFAEHQQVQWLPPEAVRERQLGKLRRLLAHAARNVPYYRELHRKGLMPDYIDSQDEMRQIPVLTKRMLMDRIDEFVDESRGAANLLPRRSGGSTGEPLKFFISPEGSDASSAAENWGDSLAGYRPGDPAVWIWGTHFHEPPPCAGQRMLQYLSNMDVLITDNMDKATLQAAVDKLNAVRPTVIIGYKNSLVELAEYIRRNGIIPSFPRKGIISTAETLMPHQRALLEEIYGPQRVFNRYGTREANLVAMECDHHRGMHVCCENVHVDKEPISDMPGYSSVVITKLDEMGLPLIRYDLDDCVAEAPSEWCTCGRGYPLLGELQGRLLSILRRTDGSAVGGQVFVCLLDYEPIRQYRIVQEEDYSIRILVVPTEGFDSTIKMKIIRETHRLVGQVPVEVEICTSIPATRSSKLLPIISKVDASRKMASVSPQQIGT